MLASVGRGHVAYHNLLLRMAVLESHPTHLRRRLYHFDKKMTKLIISDSLIVNAGVWFMHCHLDIHQSWGLGTVLVVTNGQGELETLPHPPADLPQC